MKGIVPEMFLPEWILSLGFKVVPLHLSIHLFEGLNNHGWKFLFDLISEVLYSIFPLIQYQDMGNTLYKIKNHDQLKNKWNFKYEIPWERIFHKIL